MDCSFGWAMAPVGGLSLEFTVGSDAVVNAGLFASPYAKDGSVVNAEWTAAMGMRYAFSLLH